MKNKILLLLFLCFMSMRLPAQQSAVVDFISKGIEAHDKGNFAGAIALYKKALQLDKQNPHAHYELATSYFSLKEYSNSIKHCNLVIDANSDYVDQAYILKGSALDVTGKPHEAITVYKKALKTYTGNHLLYYNLAVTSFGIKAYADCEDALKHSLKLNPYHAGSHFLLGLLMVTQEHRVKGILAIYHFLLLEPKSERTSAALVTLQEEMQKKFKQGTDQADEFYTAELMLNLLESSKTNEINTGKTAQELFVYNTKTLFTILGELKKDNKGFWWDFYVDYFYSLAKEGHSEAFCYYITQSKAETYNTWLPENKQKLDAFSDWYLKHTH